MERKLKKATGFSLALDGWMRIMESLKKIYHRIRRFFFPELYYTKEDINQINNWKKRAHSTMIGNGE